ncbi:MAG: TetR/AcrR family transcriptional regulator [Candidatus Dormibacteraeota bacterium]|nr:TetR/AcrR family transcriptional regulator [Candidatus Dormibacteraeota bacterium]
MSSPKAPKNEALSSGRMRHRQKNRTRKALLNAAAELVRQGREPTVAEVAEVAEVSRATAYRYFPTQESLLVEMRMFAPEGPIEMFDRVVLETGDPVERVGVLARQVSEWAFQNETALRTWLRLSLDPETGVKRPGHRIRWIAEALQPLQGKVDGATLDRLSGALTMLLGIDPIIPLTDFAELPAAEAIEVIEWAARALVRSVVDDVVIQAAPITTPI